MNTIVTGTVNIKTIVTVWSKYPQTDATGSAVAELNHRVEFNKRTSDCLNVYTVQLYAMLMILEWI